MNPTGEVLLGAFRRAVEETGVDPLTGDVPARLRLERAVERECRELADDWSLCSDCGAFGDGDE